MSDTTDMTMLKYREFDVYFVATEQADGSWHVEVQVYLGNKQIDLQNLSSNYPTRQAAEMAGYGYGCASAERWRAKKEFALALDGTIILVGGIFYQFESSEEAAAAVQWMWENDASPAEFDIQFAQFRHSTLKFGSKNEP